MPTFRLVTASAKLFVAEIREFSSLMFGTIQSPSIDRWVGHHQMSSFSDNDCSFCIEFPLSKSQLSIQLFLDGRQPSPWDYFRVARDPPRAENCHPPMVRYDTLYDEWESPHDPR